MIRTGSNLYSVLENKRYSSRNMSFKYRLTTRQNGEHRYLSIFTSDRSNQTKTLLLLLFCYDKKYNTPYFALLFWQIPRKAWIKSIHLTLYSPVLCSDVTLDTSNHKHDTEKTPIANFSRVLVERNPDQEINQPTKRNGSMPWFSWLTTNVDQHTDSNAEVLQNVSGTNFHMCCLAALRPDRRRRLRLCRNGCESAGTWQSLSAQKGRHYTGPVPFLNS